MGFINVNSLQNWQRKRHVVTLEMLLADICNLQQMVLDVKIGLEQLESRLVLTGTERIG